MNVQSLPYQNAGSKVMLLYLFFFAFFSIYSSSKYKFVLEKHNMCLLTTTHHKFLTPDAFCRTFLPCALYHFFILCAQGFLGKVSHIQQNTIDHCKYTKKQKGHTSKQFCCLSQDMGQHKMLDFNKTFTLNFAKYSSSWQLKLILK